jgi:hypothetical protein
MLPKPYFLQGISRILLSLLEAKTVSRWPHVAKTLFFAGNLKDFIEPS